MNNAMFKVEIQAISALAVAGGLIYAALQFRGWRTTQYVTNFTELVKLQLELRKMVVDDAALATAGLVRFACRDPSGEYSPLLL